MNDQINPTHYKGVEISGVQIQCIDVVEVLELNFHLGSALKYAWRFGRKHDRLDEEIAKCLWYLDRWRGQGYELRALGRPIGSSGPFDAQRHAELAGNLRNMCGAWKHHEAVKQKAGPLWMDDSIAWMRELIATLDIEDAVGAHVVKAGR